MSDGDLLKKLGIDAKHMNDILASIFTDIAQGKITSRIEMAERAKEFNKAERNLLIILGIESIIENANNVEIVE